MKKLLITILIMSVLGVFVACDTQQPTTEEQKADVEQETAVEEPAFTPREVIDEEACTQAIDFTMPDASDADAVKRAAFELFQLANSNDQDCLRRLAYTENIVSTSGIATNNLVIDLKNNGEYLKYDFQPTIKTDVLKIEVDGHGKATYTNVDLANAYYVEVGDSVINADWTGYADFGDTDGTLVQATDSMYFHASQAPHYCVTEATVTLDTIQSATLTHNDAGGYYVIEFKLDPEAATAAILLPNLRKNSGIGNAKYTSITETIEIWDNGFFKRFLSVDKWKGTKALVVSINSTIHFDTVYKYDAASCNLGAYCNGYYSTIKSKAEAANGHTAQ